ncbi:3-isopropylmalate dehydrogenase [Gimibacter soli]|uniref:3-isopropylmalate dehydrogenase n=1 Tax=Gimibacter soli TaxID=3024400 RepID=A0AAF0BLD8_9PROT|nr:3-isopropylmalate dehydrogenase [Gimibacter soli]WCL54032.1 3-isopropylmalate dehydrogenase [Gimibacter soli]
MTSFNLLLLPGDGIGPEIMTEAKRVLDWAAAEYGVTFNVSEDLIGGCAYEKYGVPLADETLAKAKASDAVVMGSVGGPQWDGKVAYDKRPEAGLLKLRKELDVFANLRSAICFDALADASSLKRDLVAGLDILFVRELSSGVYFGNPRGIEDLPEGGRVGINTQRYTDKEIIRVARVAFEMARKRGSRVASADKANVMESGVLWREEVTKLRDAEYPDVALEHVLADNCAMQLVRAPKQYDIILTDNLFGDILSDAAAMLTGSLGMLPSASLGDGGPGLYEPVHGSAPDIAGKGVANPIAMILSMAMALRYSLGLGEAADRIEKAVDGALNAGFRTGDIMSGGMTRVGTTGMGDAILAELQKN